MIRMSICWSDALSLWRVLHSYTINFQFLFLMDSELPSDFSQDFIDIDTDNNTISSWSCRVNLSSRKKIPVKHDDEDCPYQEMDTAWKLVLTISPTLCHRSVFSLMTSCIFEIVTEAVGFLEVPPSTEAWQGLFEQNLPPHFASSLNTSTYRNHTGMFMLTTLQASPAWKLTVSDWRSCWKQGSVPRHF